MVAQSESGALADSIRAPETPAEPSAESQAPSPFAATCTLSPLLQTMVSPVHWVLVSSSAENCGLSDDRYTTGQDASCPLSATSFTQPNREVRDHITDRDDIIEK